MPLPSWTPPVLIAPYGRLLDGRPAQPPAGRPASEPRSGRGFHRPGGPAASHCAAREWSLGSTGPARSYEGWGKYNRHYWLSDYEDFLEFFFSRLYNEPHSTKPREDAVAWGMDTDRRDTNRHATRHRIYADKVRALADAGALPGARHPRHGGRESDRTNPV